MPTSGVRLRLFFTCWIVFVLHFATDFVREHYLVISMVEDHTYALDKYYGLHVDIFQNPPSAKVQGAHHGRVHALGAADAEGRVAHGLVAQLIQRRHVGPDG